jgi:7-keto-8-aminopelargonate synthetase-like enzyme
VNRLPSQAAFSNPATGIFMSRNFPRLARAKLVSVSPMQEAESLQQVRRTYIRYRGKTLSYFGGCDYHRFASHPKILQAVSTGMRRYGLNVAASRITTGNHEVYLRLEQALAEFFGAETALLTNSGYVTSMLVAQALAGQFSHALLDARAHAALQDAAELLNCPVVRFKHRDIANFATTLQRCGKSTRPIVLTDGMYAHEGSVAPLAEYLKLLPRDGLLVVDDAHGVGTVGKTGRGSIEVAEINRHRVVQNITLSKALGVYGGAIICSTTLRERLVQSRLFIGSTPLPLPLACAATTALKLLQSDPDYLKRLRRNTDYLKTKLRAAGFPLEDFPGPIVPVHLHSQAANTKLKSALLAAKILPPLINYPGSPARGYFRFVISSEHTKQQLDHLAVALTPMANLLAV